MSFSITSGPVEVVSGSAFAGWQWTLSDGIATVTTTVKSGGAAPADVLLSRGRSAVVQFLNWPTPPSSIVYGITDSGFYSCNPVGGVLP